MDTLTVLRSARKLLSDPKRWTKGHYAQRNEDGACYCALGALRAAVGKGDLTDEFSHFPNAEAERLYIQASDELAKTLGLRRGDYVPGWNDGLDRTYEDVMAAFSVTCERVFAESQQDQGVAVA